MGLALRRQESGLEEDGGGERRHERERHQLAHARRSRMVRKPQAAEGGGRRAGAEENGSRQARLQEVRLARPPRHDVVDFEGDPDAQEQRQRDDVGEIQLSPIATQISSVTTMATSRGTSVSATSLQRRSATKRISAIDTSDQTAASRNALTMVAAASTMKTGVPVAWGATPRTASTKRRRTALSFPSPLGATSILTSTVRRNPVASERGRKRVERHMLRGQEIPHLAKRRHERGDQNALRFVSFRRRRLRQGGQQARQPARLAGGGAVDFARRGGKVAGRLVDRRDRIGRGRRGVDLIRD